MFNDFIEKKHKTMHKDDKNLNKDAINDDQNEVTRIFHFYLLK